MGIDTEQLELSKIASGNIKCQNHFEKLFGLFFKGYLQQDDSEVTPLGKRNESIGPHKILHKECSWQLYSS